jgi:N,N-dimethylformamidase
MTLAELPITGYLDRFSHRPGEEFAAHVSLRDGGEYRVRMVRVISGDPNPAGPGLRFEDLSARFDQAFAGHRQPIRLGSYGEAPAPKRDPRAACTWAVLLWHAEPQTATVLAEVSGETTVALALSAEGAEARLAWPGGSVRLATGKPLALRRWYRLFLAADPASGRVVVGQQELDALESVVAEATASGLVLPSGGRVTIAAENPADPTRHFTGKLEDPALLPGFRAAWPDSAAQPEALGACHAAWDFSRGIDTQTITDTGPQACHGRLVNLPTRAVVGARWSGTEMCWRHAVREYGAIHFHDDDLADCGWDVSFRFAVPTDLRGGAYAFHLTCAGGEDYLPFYVLPPRQGPHAKLAFIAATFTYQAYANHARGNADEAYHARAAAWGAAPANPDQFPIYGRSTYNKHRDGSGIAFSSRLRPVLTMRPGFLTFDDPRGSGLRHYPADTHILAWLEKQGIAFDVVTDEDLDEEGPALLAPYRAVLTGSHPEYHTANTLDALGAYIRSGGRLAYLGGNGFYWRIARHKELPGVIELRRAEGGIRAWAAEPGEYYHAFDGQYGGLWRRNRRPPQELVGVGFSGQGLFEGTHYRRTEASRDSVFAWMFEGIAEEVIGDYGLSGGGAAGFELDRADPVLGTPEGTVILARSEDPPPSFVTVPEELLTHVTTLSGEPTRDLMRAEIVTFETAGGGSVFSVGSITFCGSLWRDGEFQGPVSRLLENVVRRWTA